MTCRLGEWWRALDLRPNPTNPGSALRRVGVMSVAVPLTNLPIPAVDEDLGPLIGGDLRRPGDRLGLRLMDARRPAVSLAPDRPSALVRDDVLVLPHVSPPGSKRVTGMCTCIHSIPKSMWCRGIRKRPTPLPVPFPS